MSKILITGGSGFIGSNLIPELLRAGHEVLNLDVKAPPVPAHMPSWQRVDILDKPALVKAVETFQPDYIHHLAARTDMHGAAVADYPANTTGVSNMIDAAQASSALKRIVFASSRLVCEIGYQPKSPTDYTATTAYGQSKVAGEKLVYAAKLNCEWAIVRPTSIWGPHFHVPYRNFFDAIQHGRYIHPRGRRVRKSFGFVGNTVFQLQQLMRGDANAVHSKMFYLADYEPIEVLEWGELIRAAFDAPGIKEVPMGAMKALAKVGDGLATLGWKNVPLTSFRLDNLLTEMLHDTDPLQAVCGKLPHTVNSGVPITVNWMQGGVSALDPATAKAA